MWDTFLLWLIYVKHPRAASAGWISAACGYCTTHFAFLYKDRVGCQLPASATKCSCSVCSRQPPTLKGTASDVALRYVFGLDNYRMTADVTFPFIYVANSGRVTEDQLFPHDLPCTLVTYLDLPQARPETLSVQVAHFQPSCLSVTPVRSIDCGRVSVTVTNKAYFIQQLLSRKPHYWCAKCERLLKHRPVHVGV